MQTLSIVSIKPQQVKVTYSIGVNISQNATEFINFALLSNGEKVKVSDMFTYIHNELDSPIIVSKIRKSKSEKTKIEYLNKFLPAIIAAGIIQ